MTPEVEAKLEVIAHAAFCDGVEASCRPEWEYPVTDWDLCPEGQRLRDRAISFLNPDPTSTKKDDADPRTDTATSSARLCFFMFDRPAGFKTSRDEPGT